MFLQLGKKRLFLFMMKIVVSKVSLSLSIWKWKCGLICAMGYGRLWHSYIVDLVENRAQIFKTHGQKIHPVLATFFFYIFCRYTTDCMQSINTVYLLYRAHTCSFLCFTKKWENLYLNQGHNVTQCNYYLRWLFLNIERNNYSLSNFVVCKKMVDELRFISLSHFIDTLFSVCWSTCCAWRF